MPGRDWDRFERACGVGFCGPSMPGGEDPVVDTDAVEGYRGRPLPAVLCTLFASSPLSADRGPLPLIIVGTYRSISSVCWSRVEAASSLSLMRFGVVNDVSREDVVEGLRCLRLITVTMPLPLR